MRWWVFVIMVLALVLATPLMGEAQKKTSAFVADERGGGPNAEAGTSQKNSKRSSDESDDWAKENLILRVYVLVNDNQDNDSFGSLVTSYVKRELRELKDIKLVSNQSEAHFSLQIQGFMAHSNGVEIGCVLSCLGLERPNFVGYLLSELQKEGRWRSDDKSGIGWDIARISPSFEEAIKDSQIWDIAIHSVQSCAPEKLKEQCTKIVAVFDSKVLEARRSLMQGLIEATKKSKQAK